MKLENTFTIDAPVEKAWKALNTPEAVAPCFPGATLTTYEGDSFAGTVKVKLGPIAMTYKGKGTYVSRDDAAKQVVIEANGRDSRGNGTANATVTASLAADGADTTSVSMVTDMTITGKPAQFGRGVISDVADKIIRQFAGCVARKLAEEEATVPASSAAGGSEATSDIPTPVPASRGAPTTAPGGGLGGHLGQGAGATGGDRGDERRGAQRRRRHRPAGHRRSAGAQAAAPRGRRRANPRDGRPARPAAAGPLSAGAASTGPAQFLGYCDPRFLAAVSTAISG
jgi:uncharacterized protein